MYQLLTPVADLYYNCSRLLDGRTKIVNLQFAFRVPDRRSRRPTVAVEVLYFDGTVPHIYVEDEYRGARTEPVMPPEVLASHVAEDGTLVVTINSRQLPLSSVHGERKFRLAFVFDDDVPGAVITKPFAVRSKQGKAGTGKKDKKMVMPQPLTCDRLERCIALATKIHDETQIMVLDE